MTREEAIEKFKKIKRGNIFLIHQRYEGKEVIEDYSLCDMAISALQAQDLQPTCNQLATDYISRQAAIDALEESKKQYFDRRIIIGKMQDIINNLPSAQPEPLTDKEQRIFLAAMAREERVCEEVDRNYVREPYEDSLMRVCREIERKVKGALWT